MAVTKGKNRDSDQSNENGSGLPGAESLPQDKGAKQDVHDWGHEIAQAGFEDVTDVDRPNEEQPIQANHDTAAQTKKCAPSPAKVADDFTPALLPAEQKAEKHNGPDEAMRENFQGWDPRKQFPINWHQSPRCEGCNCSDEGRRVLRIASTGPGHLARISSIPLVRNPSLAGDAIVCNDGMLELIA